MQANFNAQRDTHDRILRAHVNFKKSPKERLTEHYAQTRVDILERLWENFMSVHQNMLKTTDWETFQKSTYVTEEFYEKTEELYINYKCELMKYLSKPKLSGANSNAKSCVKLPKIEIPKFSGIYSEWVTFRDLFVALVHTNTSLDNVEKLHYLKGHLTGEAEQLIRQIPIANENYLECWGKLEARYNNINFLANSILKRFLSLKASSVESATNLKNLIDTTADCLHALKNIGINVDTWDIIVIHIVASKLDSETRKQWELTISSENSSKLPTFNQFKEFMQARFRALEFIEPSKLLNPTVRQTKPKVLHVASTPCEFCGENHRLHTCKRFSQEEVNKRREFVFTKRLCYNCMGDKHSARVCPSKISCRKCKGKHHTLLHPLTVGGTVGSGVVGEVTSNVGSSLSGEVIGGSTAGKPAASSSQVDAAPVVACFGQMPIKHQIFLPTAVVRADMANGQCHFIRAFLDQGAQGSFISEATVQHLGIKRYPIRGVVSGLEGANETSYKHMVYVKIRSRFDYNVVINVQAYVLKSITSLLPNRAIERIDWLDEGICLADPEYHIPNRIDILLGSDIYGLILQNGVRKGPQGFPLAQETSLGWILSGITQTSSKSTGNIVAMHLYVEDELLRKFWEIEADPKPQQKFMTEEQLHCERFYADTTTRDAEGRYVVRLPFKTDKPECMDGDSRAVAEKRLNGLCRRFKGNEELKVKYKEVIQEYLHLGFMERVPDTERNMEEVVYLPHHPVVRTDKDTTKLRVVYDASCKYKNGSSLNDNLMTGPSLQQELRHLLMQWRMKPICIAADVVKMYCQVKVSDKDVNYQRLLWKEDIEDKAEDYRLLRVTFGTASAPYLAVRTLQQVAQDEGAEYPVAAKMVLNNFYMDDLLTGCDSVEEGMVIYEEMNQLLKKGGFELQKWMSNNEDLLRAIKQRSKDNDVQEELKLKLDNIVKLLGLTWDRGTDTFRYTVADTEDSGPVTKRQILSHIARLYDPLGWAAPSVIMAKILIQKLWIAGLEWDEEVSSKILEEWNIYRRELPLLSEIHIPRWVGTCVKKNSQIELHGFADASKVAYAAAVYIRSISEDGEIYVTLVTAKTKVAPIKQVSIPRLELCGAVLVTRLLIEVAETLGIDKTNIRAWTDSTVVLAWMNSHPSRWQTFVANRVSEILTKLESSKWAHVPSGQNPADAASRGMKPSDLVKNGLWFNGPNFLRERVIKYEKLKDMETNMEEIKVHAIRQKDSPETAVWEKYSSLTRLVRVISYCRRFLNLKKPAEGRPAHGYLTTQELKEAIEVCIRQVQGEHFQGEIELIRKEANFSKLNGPLKSLSPFISREGLLRVGGRLDKSQLGEEAKHPVILPRKAHLTDLILTDAHAKTQHGGVQLMLTYLSRKYYIIGAKPLVKAFVRRCVKCVRQRAAVSPQLMGQLPAARVTPTRPFTNSGVDFAGPINVRTTKGRGHQAYKGYICLFVCMATRAIHIEVVSDLTSQGFLAAFRRFVARRGHCADIWSDNGKNFVGASRELRDLFLSEKASMVQEVAEELANNGTTWHFIPPHAPNFGGLWEAGIKSVKHHLKRGIGETTLTYEELSTLLAQIEACLNSRPLSQLNTDSDALDVLTPGHFLVGGPLVTPPDYNFESVNVSNLRRWQLTQKMLQIFWRRWSHEYLNKFLHRYKWSYQTPEPNIGNLVLVKEDGLPPCRWLLGRVMAKHPGPDNVTRVVTLKTKNSVIKRAISKLCVLPIAI